MGQAINSEMIHKFGNYVVTRLPIERNTFDYNLTLLDVSGGIWIGQSLVVENRLTYCLILNFEIFPQFRRQGHGSAFLEYLTEKLKPQEIKLFPLALLPGTEDESYEEIAEIIDRDKEALKIKTEQIMSFYSTNGLIAFYHKNGFKWDKNKEYLVFK